MFPPGAGCVMWRTSGSTSGMWKWSMVRIMRHRQAKEPESGRPDLTHGVTSRLYMVFPVLVKNVIDFAPHRRMMTQEPFISRQSDGRMDCPSARSLPCPSLHFTRQIAGIPGLVYKKAQTISCRENLLTSSPCSVSSIARFANGDSG
jgi:hypothetical protein